MERQAQEAGQRTKAHPDMAIRDIHENIDRFVRTVDEQVGRVMGYVGETFQGNARGTNTYKDKTANLRNSIGYYLLTKDGPKSSFNHPSGEELARSIAARYKGIALVLAAGMPYARYVEAKGYDVISNSVDRAKAQHQKMMKQALQKAVR